MTKPLRKHTIAVIGAGDCDEATAERAREVGRRLAQADCILVTGGLGGVMEAASRGASEAGGLVIGILPGGSAGDANRFVDVAIATGMGEARNAVICNTAEAFVAVGGRWGTLSEIALALRLEKRVVSLGSFERDLPVESARDAEDAVRRVLAAL